MVTKLLNGNGKVKRSAEKVQAEITWFHSRILNIEDSLADRVIDLETFNRTKARYSTELSKLKVELSDNSTSQTSFSGS